MSKREKAVDRTPLQAIRARCMDCSGFEHKEVRGCDRVKCELHPFRIGRKPAEPVSLTVLQSIRRYCCDNCMCGQPNEVRLCPQGPDGPGTTCLLYEFRFGTNPNRASAESAVSLVHSPRARSRPRGRSRTCGKAHLHLRRSES